MIRNLKAFGLALVAIFALSAMAASTASAETKVGVLTSDGTFTLFGAEVGEAGENELSYPGLPGARCPGTTFHGGAVDETISEGVHDFLHGGETSFTVTPTYVNCKVGIFPSTVTMTGCDFDFELGETTPGIDTYSVSATLTCPDDKVVHLTSYSDAGHTNQICTVTFGKQHPNSDELHATDNTDGTVTISGKVTGIKANKIGGGCGGAGETEEATYNVNVEMSGLSEEAVPTDISISEETLP